MTLTLISAAQILKDHHLLRIIVKGEQWSLNPTVFEGANRRFTNATYNTTQVKQGSLLFCKGAFKAEYLTGCSDRDLYAYVSERPYLEVGNATGLIVSDVRKAMSLLSTAFYDYPQHQLTLIGITGTKGKTTTAYFTQAILNAATAGKAALFSSVGNCLDGHTYLDSALTTPESLDAMRMMRTAVDNGMQYLVMEVSSQAYKVDRVYGLTFDIGAFLNISPDHISPIEHPTFMDYFSCKLKIVSNSRVLVLDAQSAHADLIEREAADAGVPVRTFALESQHPLGAHSAEQSTDATHRFDMKTDTAAWPLNAEHNEFAVRLHGRDQTNAQTTADDAGPLTLRVRLNMEGDFNYANAAAALTIAKEAGVNVGDPAVVHALENVNVPGRMEEFSSKDGNTVAIVDYAHNFASISAIIDFAMKRYAARNPRITLVSGSAGGKAIDRREGIVKAAQGQAAEIILTSDDPDHESAQDICEQMQSHIDDPHTSSRIILDRAKAVETAIAQAQARTTGLDVVIVAGKGEEQWIKVNGRHVPYEGDTAIVQRLLG